MARDFKYVISRDPREQIFQGPDGGHIIGRHTTVDEEAAILKGQELPGNEVTVQVPTSKLDISARIIAGVAVLGLLVQNGPTMVQASTNFLGLNTSSPPAAASIKSNVSSPSAKPTESSTPSAKPKPNSPTISPTPSPTSQEKTEVQCLQDIPLNDKIDMSLLLGVYPSGKASNTSNNLAAISQLSRSHFFGGLVVMTNPNGDELVSYKKNLKYPQTIMIDQEGGPVQRIPYGNDNKTTDPSARISSQSEFGKMSESDREKFIKNVLVPMYSHLKSLGIDMVAGPVVDIADSTVEKSPLQNRMFANDSKVVSELALAYINAAKTAGIRVAPKHFPGLGAAHTFDGGDGNTDQRKMIVDNWNKISEEHLAPYKAIGMANGEIYIMVGTQTIPDLSGDKPAALSKETVDLLKQIIPNATVISDDLVTPSILDSKLGVGMTASRAVVEALKAGVNHPMLVRPNTSEGWDKQLESIYSEASKEAQQSPEFQVALTQLTFQNIKNKKMTACEVEQSIKQR